MIMDVLEYVYGMCLA